jgi:membrane associated rhomboid family serine protease
MGLYDRDYSREETWSPQTPWSRSQGGLSITAMLIIANIAIFFVDMILTGRNASDSVLANWFEVRPDTILKPWTWYQFLTYGFIHSQIDIRHVAFNMLGLFFFGGTVEQRLGRREFIRFYLLAIVVGGVVSSLRWTGYAWFLGESPAMIAGGTIGASGAVMAVTILFAFLEPHSTIYLMMVLPVKAWLVAVLFVGMNIFGFIGASDNVAYDVHLAGAAFAALYFKQGWRLTRFHFGNWGESLARLTQRTPRLRLHDPERKLAQEEAEADRILEKIQASGLDSLTKAERKTLERHSRRKRESRNR